VDYYTFAPPGESQVVVPIDVAVGEKSEIGQYRRPLKLDCITRLALSWQVVPGTVPPSSVLTLGALTLVPRAPFLHDFAELLKIDVQPRSAPVETAFTGLFGSEYSTLNGYGLIDGTQVYQMQDRVSDVRNHLL
jgi:hypothetical protein